MNKNHFPKLVILVSAIICVLLLIQFRIQGKSGDFWKTVINDDGRGYYAYLPAIFIYQDLYFDFVKDREEELLFKSQADYIRLGNGQRGNKYYPGVALMLTPFFLLATLLSQVFHYPIDGYNIIYMICVCAGTLFYVLIGLFYINRLLILYDTKPFARSIILISILFGTNLLNYTIFEVSKSHAYSFAAIALFAFHTRNSILNFSSRSTMLAIASLGLIFILRPVNILVLLAIPFLAGSIDVLKKYLIEIRSQTKPIIQGIIIGGLITSILPILTYLMTGSLFTWAYKGEGFNFGHPEWVNVLFSYRRGLLLYTPILLLCFCGLIPMYRKSVFSFITYILFFIIITYVISSWWQWYYGGSFSSRPFVEYYPILFIGLAYLLNSLRSVLASIIIGLSIACILLLNLVQHYQYEEEIIDNFMNKEKYREVFLQTNSQFRNFSRSTPPDTLDQMAVHSTIHYYNDFDSGITWNNEQCLTTKLSFSGNRSCEVMLPNSFSPGITINMKDISDSIDQKIFVDVNLMVYLSDLDCGANLVVSLTNLGKTYFYPYYFLSVKSSSANQWQEIKYGCLLPTRFAEENELQIYVWNNSKIPIYLDDIKIDIHKLY